MRSLARSTPLKCAQNWDCKRTLVEPLARTVYTTYAPIFTLIVERVQMSKKQLELHLRKEAVSVWLTSHGWVLDRWGHYKRMGKDNRPMRIKFNPRKIRCEVKLSDNTWVRRFSCPWEKVSITERGLMFDNK